MTPDGNDYHHLRVNMKHVLRAHCCKCGATGDRVLPKGRTCEQPFADKMFRNAKWRLGNDRTKDTCPDCIKANKLALVDLGDKIKLDDHIEMPTHGSNGNPNSLPSFALADSPTEETDRLSSDQTALAELLRESLSKGSDGLYRYRPGFTDASIASSTGFPIEHVRQVRVSVFGLARKRTVKPGAPLGVQATSKALRELSSLEATVLAQGKELAALRALVEAQALDSARRDTEASKAMMALTGALTRFQGRLEELSHEFDELTEPMSVSPRTLLQMFKGSVRESGTRHKRHG